MTRRVAALAVLLAVACGDDVGNQAVDTTATSGRSATTTSATATTGTTTCPTRTGEVVATADLDGDGTDERWVPAGTGASVDVVALERVDGCAAVPVTLDGAPAEFAVGGTVLLLQGVRCEGEVVVHLGASSDDGERYETLDVLYELREGELVRVGDRSGTLRADDPALQDYSSFDC